MPEHPTVYLDHAATTPMVPAAVEALMEELGQVGNASSLHRAGRRARRVVEESRERIAAALGCRPVEVVLTSGGTEADNLVLKGSVSSVGKPRILSSVIEHHAVLDSLRWLETQGVGTELLPVDREGVLDVEALRASIESDPASVALVSVMWANNEVGAVQPVREVVDLAAGHGITVHTDAVQAVGQVPVDFAASGVDALTLTAHKIGGPLGVGALVARRDLALTPQLHGGGQERDVRSGTFSTPLIAGFAVAVENAVKEQAAFADRVSDLRDRLVAGVHRAVPDATLNGPVTGLPGIANIAFPGCDADALLMLLDGRGIAASLGSACTAGVPETSHVLLAMGLSEERARSSLRFSLGHTSVLGDVEALLAVLPEVVAKARNAR